MGDGGSIREAGKAIDMSGDEGIDGIIKEDLRGLDVIYIQAKKWEGSVERPEIQKFAGVLQYQRNKKGIFITTGYFSQVAKNYVLEYMIEDDVGVSVERSFIIKKINSDYFESALL